MSNAFDTTRKNTVEKVEDNMESSRTVQLGLQPESRMRENDGDHHGQYGVHHSTNYSKTTVFRIINGEKVEFK